ncbi:MAG: phage tail protein [Rhodoferax sp.]|nr:phage tail protein [Rhodoferax sp.]
MKFGLDITGIDQLKKKLSDDEKKRNKAVVTALNRAASRGQTEIRKGITERYAVKSSEVSGSMTTKKATLSKEPAAYIHVFGNSRKFGRSLNVIRFMETSVTLAQAKKRMKLGTLNKLHFKFIKGSGRKVIEGAFLGNRGRTIFRRTGDKRLPIEPVLMVGVGQMLMQRSVHKQVMGRIQAITKEELARALAELDK